VQCLINPARATQLTSRPCAVGLVREIFDFVFASSEQSRRRLTEGMAASRTIPAHPHWYTLAPTRRLVYHPAIFATCMCTLPTQLPRPISRCCCAFVTLAFAFARLEDGAIFAVCLFEEAGAAVGSIVAFGAFTCARRHVHCAAIFAGRMITLVAFFAREYTQGSLRTKASTTLRLEFAVCATLYRALFT